MRKIKGKQTKNGKRPTRQEQKARKQKRQQTRRNCRRNRKRSAEVLPNKPAEAKAQGRPQRDETKAEGNGKILKLQPNGAPTKNEAKTIKSRQRK